MARKKPEPAIPVTVTLPQSLVAEVMEWAERENLTTDALAEQALRRYLKEERRKAFLATNPIYE
jgi:predicted transcriptional regulator